MTRPFSPCEPTHPEPLWQHLLLIVALAVLCAGLVWWMAEVSAV